MPPPPVRAHEQLLRVAGLHRAAAGQHFEARGIDFVRIRPRRAGGDPVGERAMITRAFQKPNAALVRHATERLQDDEALVGERVINAPAVNFLAEPVDVPFRRETDRKSVV